jgi:hypothetical protein
MSFSFFGCVDVDEFGKFMKMEVERIIRTREQMEREERRMMLFRNSVNLQSAIKCQNQCIQYIQQEIKNRQKFRVNKLAGKIEKKLGGSKKKFLDDSKLEQIVEAEESQDSF